MQSNVFLYLVTEIQDNEASSSHILVIALSAVGTAVAVGFLIFAIYWCYKLNRQQKQIDDLPQEKKDIMETLKDLRYATTLNRVIYRHSVNFKETMDIIL